MLPHSTEDLKLIHYDYPLDQERVAQYPCSERDHSKLLTCSATDFQIGHRHFFQLPELLPRDTLLVLNQSKVFPCRLEGNKTSGGQAEIFLLKTIPVDGAFPALIQAGGKKKPGDEFVFQNGLRARLKALGDNGTFWVQFNRSDSELLKHLDELARVPIPPYIRSGESEVGDKHSYQTVYAKNPGSVAAPTAGLHFTPQLFEQLKAAGIDTACVTLHVGLGTFYPVRAENLLDHRMHSEEFYVDEVNLEKIENARKQGKKIVAVGTTTLRVLESMFLMQKEKALKAHERYQTSLFLHPGKEVQSVDGLITNFHLPKSSLLMLVAALIGRQKTLEIYALAQQHHYRFFSYGDAMFIRRWA